jgi:quercetin dioxygenase-like cupin family protein
MKIARLTTDDEGRSRWDDIDIPVQTDSTAAPAPLSALAVAFGTIPPGLVTDWHPSAIRGLVITLRGEVEHEAADGTCRRFGPGDIFLAEDTTGTGHRTRSHGSQPCTGLVIALAVLMAPVRGRRNRRQFAGK